MRQEKAVSRPKVASQIDVFLESNHVSNNNLQDSKTELMWILSSQFNEQGPLNDFSAKNYL